MASIEGPPLHQFLCDLYRKYRQTQNIDDKAPFFSQECHQICRTDPSYAAQNRDNIIRYLHEAGELVSRILREAPWKDDVPSDDASTPRSFYTIRPLIESEAGEFGTMRELSPAGYTSVEELKNKAEVEKWAGLRVNMWTDDGRGRGLLVKVKYWWRLEASESDATGTWKQILHDILYLGPTDGTEEDGGGQRFED
ncbi:hypothetical protein FSARC_319 [Fusarium sarcochroum]|uniref:SnoaL-like domain-containing protein n=1 Tax=Fusarium sarcochroum TaxID=1208366 RepID=A0A8H4UBG7_9HYPO|nr:hypothetical protein FSARC_319 [Fusarium sarcochroum]